MESLKHGQQGQPVLNLQCALAAEGAFAGNLDGCFGSATVEAVKAFQTSHALPATGMVDAKTLAALVLQPPSVPASLIPNVTAAMVARIFPEARLADITSNLPHVLNALVEAKLTDPQIVAMALSTIRVETAAFLPISEGPSTINTSPGGKPFDLYDQRAALGNTGHPDGEKFRGRGFIQLTGRANYQRHGKAIGLGIQLVNNPLLAHQPATAARLLADFLKLRQGQITSALGSHDFAAARRMVNGGSNGLQQFAESFTALAALLPKPLVVLPVLTAA